MKIDTPKFNQSPNESIEAKDRLEKFKKIKTPEDLLSFMKQNINYGFIGKEGEKIYSPQHDVWRNGPQPEPKIQDTEELLKSGYGTCWEQTELERRWFSENNFEFKTLLLMFGENISSKNPAHALLTYKKEDMWHWFENTLDNYIGIHPFNNLDNLKNEARKMLTENALKEGATEEDIQKYKIYEYDAPTHGGSTDEYILQIVEKNK
jgi:hypothetical protein